MKAINCLVFFVIVLMVTFSSCKKDENSLNPKEILTSKAWKLSSSKINGVTQPIEDCTKDDFITFIADGTYTFNVGVVKCGTWDENYSGSWNLSTDGKTITLDGETGSILITESKVVITLVYGTDTSEVILVPQ